jgi:hypothetical protein
MCNIASAILLADETGNVMGWVLDGLIGAGKLPRNGTLTQAKERLMEWLALKKRFGQIKATMFCELVVRFNSKF